MTITSSRDRPGLFFCLFVTALNTHISKFDPQTFSAFVSQSALENALVTLGASMTDSQIVPVRWHFSAAQSVGFFAGKSGYYIGHLKRVATGIYAVDVQNSGGAAQQGEHITGTYNQSSWTWHDLYDEFNSRIKVMSTGSVSTFNMAVPSSSVHFIIIGANYTTAQYCGFVYVGSDGSVVTVDVYKGAALTITTGTNRITITSTASARAYRVCDITLSGGGITI